MIFVIQFMDFKGFFGFKREDIYRNGIQVNGFRRSCEEYER